MWNGEFGPVYANPTDGADWEQVNEQRYGVLKTQLELYAEKGSSWSIWLYKGTLLVVSENINLIGPLDIGFQGMIYVGEDTPYMKLLKPFLAKKKVRSPAFPLDLLLTSHRPSQRTDGDVMMSLFEKSLNQCKNGYPMLFLH
jgi:hypothetical protein